MARRASSLAGLLIHHLENISGEVFEEYPEVVRDTIRGKAGVYALYNGQRLYYVGLARNLMARVKQHLRDRHNDLWDRFSVYLTTDDGHMRELESLVLRIARPRGNRKMGRLGRSGDLLRIFDHRVRALETARRSDLLGMFAGRSKRSAEATTTGLGKRWIKIQRKYKGTLYTAHLRADGSVRFDGKVFKTPSGAGVAVLGRPCNGWDFWRYRDDEGRWVSLQNVRKTLGKRKGP